MHKIFCILGETACGKSLLVEQLCKELNLKKVVSYTTRARRTNEHNDHFFVDDNVYNTMKDSDNIIAYTEVYDKKYWSTINQIYENDIFIVDAKGLESLEKLNDLDICSIYINVPEEIRYERSQIRGDDTKDFIIQNMMESYQFYKIKSCGGFDYSINNIDTDKAYKVLKYIVNLERGQN